MKILSGLCKEKEFFFRALTNDVQGSKVDGSSFFSKVCDLSLEHRGGLCYTVIAVQLLHCFFKGEDSMRMLAAWMVLVVCSTVTVGGELAQTAQVSTVKSCCKGNVCNSCPVVYNEKVEERSSCRKTVFGKVVRRDVKRTTLSPAR